MEHRSATTLRMVAQYADESNLTGTVDEIPRELDALAAHCQRPSRDRSEISVTKLLLVLVAPTMEQAEADLRAVAEVKGWNDAIIEMARGLLIACRRQVAPRSMWASRGRRIAPVEVDGLGEDDSLRFLDRRRHHAALPHPADLRSRPRRASAHRSLSAPPPRRATGGWRARVPRRRRAGPAALGHLLACRTTPIVHQIDGQASEPSHRDVISTS